MTRRRPREFEPDGAAEEATREAAADNNRSGLYVVRRAIDGCFVDRVSENLPRHPAGTVLRIEPSTTPGWFLGSDEAGRIVASMSEGMLITCLDEIDAA